MANDLTHVMRQLRGLMRAYDRYSRAVRGQASEPELDAQFEQVVDTIRSRWTHSLDALMVSVLANAGAVVGEQPAISPEILLEEAAVLRELRAESERLRWFYEIYRDGARMQDSCPATTDEFVARLRSLHDAAKRKLSASRPLGRRDKKKRKRHVAKAVASMVIGAGCFIGNAHLPDFWKWSYGTGAGALMNATRDLVGEGSE